jgi:hypothetical protein
MHEYWCKISLNNSCEGILHFKKKEVEVQKRKTETQNIKARGAETQPKRSLLNHCMKLVCHCCKRGPPGVYILNALHKMIDALMFAKAAYHLD